MGEEIPLSISRLSVPRHISPAEARQELPLEADVPIHRLEGPNPRSHKSPDIPSRCSPALPLPSPTCPARLLSFRRARLRETTLQFPLPTRPSAILSLPPDPESDIEPYRPISLRP